ncbi:MAG: glycosyltransferase family 2 protein, partial [Alphaproteobacteria bacterium]
MVDAGADGGPSGAPSVPFIVLSFARPANILRIVESILRAAPHYRVIVCNNQPNIDIRSFVRSGDARLDLIQRQERWGPISRYHLARAAPGDYFVSLDDDVFLTPNQINLLVGCLVADPARAHGVWGEIFQAEDDRVVIQSGIYGRTCDVSVLNCAYAFTRAHVERVFGFLQV